MNLQKINNLLENGNAHMQVPVHHQAGIFGLDSAGISEFVKSNSCGLDIGCGNGSLVKYLRDSGANFEGLDIESPKEPYFINSNITGMKPMLGSIPRPDNYYDTVVSFQNIMLNRAFTFGGTLRDPTSDGSREEIEDHERRVMCGQYILYEGARVVKPGGRFIIYPEATRLEEVIGRGILSLQGISFSSEPVKREDAQKYMDWELSQYGLSTELGRKKFGDEYFKTWGLYNRTVVTKTKI